VAKKSLVEKLVIEWQNDWCSGEMIGIVVDGVILIDGGMIGSDGDNKMIDGVVAKKLMEKLAMEW